MNTQKQRMLFSILLGGCLLLLSFIVLQNRLEAELTISQKRSLYMNGKVKQQPWSVIVSQDVPIVLKNTLRYNIPELLYITQKKWNTKVKNIKLSIDIGEFNYSTSNNLSSNCDIKIKVPQRDYLTEDEKKELNFIVLNEVAHCFIGKDILINDGINWVELNAKEKEDVDRLYKKQEELFLITKCTDCQNSLIFSSPKVIYNELLADAVASLWLLGIDNDNKDLESIYKKRAIDFVKDPINTTNPSHFIIGKVEKEFVKKEFLSLEDIIKITQKSFIEYLQEMSFHYDKIKQNKKIEKEVGL